MALIIKPGFPEDGSGIPDCACGWAELSVSAAISNPLLIAVITPAFFPTANLSEAGGLFPASFGFGGLVDSGEVALSSWGSIAV